MSAAGRLRGVFGGWVECPDAFGFGFQFFFESLHQFRDRYEVAAHACPAVGWRIEEQEPFAIGLTAPAFPERMLVRAPCPWPAAAILS